MSHKISIVLLTILCDHAVYIPATQNDNVLKIYRKSLVEINTSYYTILR